jgi:putative transposase
VVGIRLRKVWNQVIKDTVAPWWAENSKEAYSSGVANLATALGNWHASRTGTRAGRTVGFPRFDLVFNSRHVA